MISLNTMTTLVSPQSAMCLLLLQNTRLDLVEWVDNSHTSILGGYLKMTCLVGV